MKRLLIVLLIALISVGCSNKNSQQSSQATPESSQIIVMDLKKKIAII